MAHSVKTMDFKTVIEKIIDAFEENKVSYALIGGFTLGAYGVGRATNDLNFLIDRKNMLRKYKIIPSTVPEKTRIEKYLSFVVFFNKFINHRKKPRRPFVEKDMKL